MDLNCLEIWHMKNNCRLSLKSLKGHSIEKYYYDLGIFEMLFYVFTLLCFPDLFPATPKTCFLVPDMPIFIPGLYHPWLLFLPSLKHGRSAVLLIVSLRDFLVPVLSSANRVDWGHCVVTWHLRHACPTSCLPFFVLSLARLPPLRHLLVPDLSSDISEILRVPAL